MALPSSEKLSGRRRGELEKIRLRRKFNASQWIILCVICVIAVLVVYSGLNMAQHGNKDRLSDAALSGSAASWLLNQQSSYGEWLGSVLGQGSKLMYESISRGFTAAVVRFLPSNRSFEELGGASKILAYLASGLLRVLFVITAWWRFWIVILLGALAWGCLLWKPYAAADFLGDLTTGRLFYSGIHAAIKKANSKGAPELMAAGLACLKSKSSVEVKYSSLGKALEESGALNETNLALAGIILEHSSLPAYVSPESGGSQSSGIYGENLLAENAENLIRLVLNVHSDCSLGKRSAWHGDSSGTGGFESPQEYGGVLRGELSRVLTPKMSEGICKFSPGEAATVVLAVEAGKVMSYGFEVGRWTRTSRFPQLAARAVLHSVSGFATDYDYDTRQDIRRAIIYGLRKSIFGPVKLALDLSDRSRAARQWVELLLADPNSIRETADEVELFGLVCECHELWKKAFLQAVADSDELVNAGGLTYSSLLFLPVANIMEIAGRTMERDLFYRLSDLIALVSARQRELEQVHSSDPGGKGVPPYEKIFSPFDVKKVEQLSSAHDVTQGTLRDWSSFRVVLNAFGWLGRRVGERTVPESSIIFLTGSKADSAESQDELSGYKGYVALRTAYLEEQFGSGWSTRVSALSDVHMSETEEEFTRALSGIREPELEDGLGDTAG